METLWFILVSFMLIMYVVLDGFDLGAGILHLSIARTDGERRAVLNTIGPVWDGNEVWLIAGGGVLYFAFPMLYASSFSGFYLPLIIVLWLLMLRGAGIELRHQFHHPMWRTFWDVLFSASSFLLAIFFGAALGNIVRGVPLNQEGYFFEPLWTTFTVVPRAGILDWFTTLMGLVALFTVTMHGANYIALKTIGYVQKRARSFSILGWLGTTITSILALIATSAIRPTIWNNYTTRPWGYVFPLAGILGLAGMIFYRARRKDKGAFLSSSGFIASTLASTAFGLYPDLLSASTDASRSITIFTAAAHPYGLSVGLAWWILGTILAISYLIYTYRVFREKNSISDHEFGY
jgi:cytochrome d ubiquinol oxidase subunit II